jgi:hypothetical protein
MTEFGGSASGSLAHQKTKAQSREVNVALGQWPSPHAKTPASGGLGLAGDRSIAFFQVCRVVLE